MTIAKSEYQYIQCQNPQGYHRMAYREWGDRNDKVLICVHGLSGNSADFQDLAIALQDHYRIICPDIVGRGESDWLADPLNYGLPLYVSDVLTLIQQLKLNPVDFLGTSMGGLIGMFLAAKAPGVISRLIINDIGPCLPAEGLKRVVKENTEKPDLQTWEQVQQYIRKRYAPSGKTSDREWEDLAKNTVKLTPENTYRLHYDPNIVANLAQVPPDKLKTLEFWQEWSSVNCPVLLLHGEHSDMLVPEIIEQMQATHPETTVQEFANCGHSPSLTSAEQIQAIVNWLMSGES